MTMHSSLLARVLSQHLHHHQQLPHWDALCLSLRLSTAAHSTLQAVQASAPASSNTRPLSSSQAAQAAASTGLTPSSSKESASRTHRARVLDGKAVAAAWSEELQQQVQDISRSLNRRPGLAVVLVGSRPDSLIYVSRKQEACKSIGIHCRVLRLPEGVSQADLQACVSEVSADRAIDGVLVQLPLPPHLDEEAVMEALDPRKDVDGFHPLNMGRMLMRGRAPRFVPATPLGVVELLSRSGISVAGKTAVVLGDSNIVGTPIAALLRDAGVAMATMCHRVSLQDWFDHQARRAAAPDVCLPRLFGPMPPGQHDSLEQQQQPHQQHQHQQQHQRQPRQQLASIQDAGGGFQPSDLPAICRTADILVVAVGSPELIRASWVKPGAVVVDVGINVVPQHRMRQSEPLAQQHPREQQEQQQQHSGMQVAQGSMPAGGQRSPPQQQQQQQESSPTGGSSSSAPGSGPGSGPSSRPGGGPNSGQGVGPFSGPGGGPVSGPGNGPGCRPEVQLQLVQTDPEGTFSLSSEYSVVGDVAHEEVAGVASVLTPVPGGVGPMTIAAVLHNTIQAAKYTAGLLRW